MLGKIDRFTLLKKLGVGEFGEVYEAFDPQANEVVTIKTCRPDIDSAQRQLFAHEAVVAAQLRHSRMLEFSVSIWTKGKISITWSKSTSREKIST